uniref:Reverse transcriptase domain-containing protein n=1 Tax=Leptobrachium leishanense TaxID=445787 RepID=A0A8C5P7I8_9ANUR
MEKTARRYDLAPTDMDCLNTLLELLEENSKETGDMGYPNLKPKSLFTPQISDYSNIEMFCKLVCQEIEKIDDSAINSSHNHNISKEEFQALKTLKEDDQITIKKADKGGNIVILSTEQYKNMVLKILTDEKTYGVLTQNPSNRFSSDLHNIPMDAREEGLITEKEYNFMKPVNPRIATFYALPKIHKKIQPPPGRPIVSGCNNLTQNASVYIDQILKNFVCELPSYIRDSTQMLQFLSNLTLTENVLLCSLDVESLYSCIPHNLGLEHVKYYLDRRGEKHKKHTTFVLQLLQFVLTHNFFLFDHKFYRQITGTAMGTSMAPSYANLHLGWWEQFVVHGPEFIEYHHRIIEWKRYIDDIFILWDGSRDSFIDFVNKLNQNDLNLKFTFEIQKHTINFLDVSINKSLDGQIMTTLYRKETATNNLLNWESFHPPPLKRGIPTGQYIRLRRTCSSLEDFKTKAKDLRAMFKQKGYPNRCLKRAYQNALLTNRDLTLQDKQKNTDTCIRMIGNFDTGWYEIRKICERYWPLLTQDLHLQKALTKHASITSRRCSNIGDQVVHSHFSTVNSPKTSWLNKPPIGTFKCGKCKGCKYIQKDSKEFTNFDNSERFMVKDFSNCNTSGIVYLLTCSCGVKYIGKTFRPLKLRILEHVRSVRYPRDTPISRHLRLKHQNNAEGLRFMVVEQVRIGPRGGNFDKKLRQREAYWIYKLGTKNPGGLNEGFTFTPFIDNTT